MFVPVPPQSNQPTPEPPDEPTESELPPDDDEAPDLEIRTLHGAAAWPAIVRWARLCRVLAVICLLIFGYFAARNLYFAVSDEQEFGRFMFQQVSPGVYVAYALLYALVAVASCISLFGFAALLHLFISIEAASHRRRDRSPPESAKNDDEPGA
jgi:hypothetical protein